MKNKSISKFVAIVLLITMLTIIAIAGTYAKYTSSFNGTGKVATADWNITLSSEGSEGTYSQTFELEASDKIYPGGSGKLGTITVKNGSNIVKAKIANVEISEIKVDNVENPIQNLTIQKPDVTSQTAIEPSQTSTFDINYNWTYSEEEDETLYAEKVVTFKVTVTVDQVV